MTLLQMIAAILGLQVKVDAQALEIADLKLRVGQLEEDSGGTPPGGGPGGGTPPGGA